MEFKISLSEREQGRGAGANVPPSLCLTEARGDFASILPGLLRHPLMEAAHNVTDIGGGEINK